MPTTSKKDHLIALIEHPNTSIQERLVAIKLLLALIKKERQYKFIEFKLEKKK